MHKLELVSRASNMLTLAIDHTCLHTCCTPHTHHTCVPDASSNPCVHRGVSIGQMLGVITIFAILVLFEVC